MHQPRARRQAVAVAILALAAAACASGGPRPPAPDDASPAMAERFRQDRLAALRRFRPARPAVDSGGECVVRQGVRPGTRLVSAYFPTRAAGEVLVTLTVDSAGRLLQYDEQRGLLRIPAIAEARTDAERERAVADAERGTRTTSIVLDMATGEGRAVNRGGGLPSEGVFGRVQELETAAELGRPGSRALRVAGLCDQAP